MKNLLFLVFYPVAGFALSALADFLKKRKRDKWKRLP